TTVVSTAGLIFLLLKSIVATHFLSSPSFPQVASAAFEASDVKLPIWFYQNPRASLPPSYSSRLLSNSLPCDKAFLGCAHQNIQHPRLEVAMRRSASAQIRTTVFISAALWTTSVSTTAHSATEKQLSNAGR